MKFYKEPTILISILLISFISIIYILVTLPSSSKATVDNVVPLPLQLNDTQSSITTESHNASQSTPQSVSQSVSQSTSTTGGLNWNQNIKKPN